MLFGISLRAMVKKEISSYENWKEAFCETAFRCVNATPIFTRFSSVFSLLKQFSGNLQRDTFEGNEACGDKENILRWKLERSLVRNSWWCLNSSHRVTLMFYAAVHYHCIWGTWEGLLWITMRPTLIKKYHQFKMWKKLSETLLCVLWIPLPEVQLSFQEAVG